MSVFIFLGILIVLVIVHELGHFVVAKLFGVKVEEFGVGYPPRAFTFGRWGGTEYTLNWIPFGGFVRLLGEDKGAGLAASEKKVAFVYSAWWKKALILVAGVVCNVILAFILFTLAASYGAPVTIDEDSPLRDKARLMITTVYEGTPAEDAGFLPGDIVVATATKKDILKELTPSAFQDFTGARAGTEMSITVQRNETSETITVTPAQGILEGKISTPAIGVSLGFILQDEAPLLSVIPIGIRETKDWLIEVTLGLYNLFTGAFTGTAKLSDVSGPVGIAVHVGEWYQLGIAHLLYFIAIISINLAVINMIPIPALDGGRLVFVLIEALIRRPIPEVIGNTLNTIGFLALIALMVVVTYNDIVRLVQS
jgi:regulator of sigma E protease